MAITDCLRCGKTYLEQEKVCPQCGTGSLDLAVISDYAKRMHRTALEKEAERLGWEEEPTFWETVFWCKVKGWLSYLWTEIKVWH